MKALFTLALLTVAYLVGIDNIMWALDTADHALRSAYATAARETESRHHGR